MPDWTYIPVFKPLLFRLPSRQARDLTLSATGGLSNLPMGTSILNLIGCMRPTQPPLRLLDAEWVSRVGLGSGLVFDSGSIVAFAQFGLGFIEIGPITVSPVIPPSKEIYRDETSTAIRYLDVPENPGADLVSRELDKARRKLATENRAIRLGVSIANQSSDLENTLDELQKLARLFAANANFVTVDTRWFHDSWGADELTKIFSAVSGALQEQQTASPVSLFVLVSPSEREEMIEQIVTSATKNSIQGFVVGGGMVDEIQTAHIQNQNYRVFGRPVKRMSVEIVKKIKKMSPEMIVIGSGGIIEPQDALDFIKSGADLLQLHSGLVFSGPGLGKRINEYLAFRSGDTIPSTQNLSASTLTEGWLSFTIVATGLIIAAVSVIYVGLTRVLLPYDEAFLGVTMNKISEINPHLLQFMSHDRVTLGGTSLSGAVLFYFVAVFGVRNRHRWAYTTEVAGLAAGFMAFFLYLGFKYFDPLHALVCVLVLPFFIWGVTHRPQFVTEQSPNSTNSVAWKNGMIGQLMFVMIGAGLLTAGITIACVGCSTIFVNEDLLYMGTTRCQLENVGPHMLPLIAHDRASFGGCLWAVGTVELLTSMYGFRQGNRWIWWALLLGGLPGFFAVFGIHFAIGYTHLMHLLPAYIAVIMYLVGLYCSYDYLCSKGD